MSYPFIEPGSDLTQIPIISDPSTPCGVVQWVSAAQIQELVANIKPGKFIGFVWVSTGQPDVQADPDFKRFIWIDISTPWPYPLRVYNLATLTWDVWTPAPGSLDGNVIIDGTLSPIKLATGGIGNAKKILQVDAQGKTFVYVFAQDAIDDGALPISKIKVPAGTPIGSFLKVVGTSTLQFVEITTDYLISLIANGSIPISKLAPRGGIQLKDGAEVSEDGVEGNSIKLVRNKAGQLVFDWFNAAEGYLDPPSASNVNTTVQVLPKVGAPGEYKYTNVAFPGGGGSAGSFIRATDLNVTGVPTGGNIPVNPAMLLASGSNKMTTTFKIAGVSEVRPKSVQAFFVCKRDVEWNGYRIGDIVPIETVEDTSDTCPYSIYANEAGITILLNNQENATPASAGDSSANSTYIAQFPGPAWISTFPDQPGKPHYTLFDLSRDFDLYYFIIQ